ncbi:hypothetical protein F4776DRAFT_674732 [Hypoxylon sp. NC0597]|nr:hypothetical protein F4776DRAFT_674732 [Hypoxylon sp. NC0597]
MNGNRGESAQNTGFRLPLTSVAPGADIEVQLQQLRSENEKLRLSLKDKDRHIQHLEAKLKDAYAKEKKPANIEEYIQEEYIREDIQKHTQENIRDDIQPYIQQAVQESFPLNTQGYFQQNAQEYVEEGVLEYIEENVQEEPMPEHVEPYFSENAQEYFQQNAQVECFQQNVQEYVQQNTQKYFPQNAQEYFTQNVQEESMEEGIELYFPQNTQKYFLQDVQEHSQQNIQPQMGSYSADFFNLPNDLATHPVTLGPFPNLTLDNHNDLGHGESGVPHPFTEQQPYPQYAETQSFSQYDVQQSAPEMMNDTSSGSVSVSSDNLPAYGEPVVISSDPATTPTDQGDPVKTSPKIPCDLCSSLCRNKESLRRHRKRVHKVSNARNTRQKGDFMCDICGESYLTAAARRAHRQRIHDPTSAHRVRCQPVVGGLTCPECPDRPHKTYTSQKMLDNHRSAVHRRG